MSINITIDGKRKRVDENSTILDVAGDSIPTLCYLKGVNNIGSCKICVVEIKGQDNLVTACNTKVKANMKILTNSEKVIEARKKMLNLLMAGHDCKKCKSKGNCELEKLAKKYGVKKSGFNGHAIKQNKNPFLSYDSQICINCKRCVAACKKLARNGVLEAKRGYVQTPFDEQWRESDCESCGNCAAACPTGALSTKNDLKYTKKVLTTCPHCATGCQFNLLVRGNKIVGTEAVDGPSNHKRLCVKGRFGSFDFVHSKERLTSPLIKTKNGKFRRASWDEALDLIASKFLEIKRKYGADALAGFACSRAPNEDCYMFQKMVRCAFGTNNVDNCARVCHSASVAGLAMTLGSGAMTNPIGDITNDVDVIMLVGSNPEEAHPVIGMQIRNAVANGTKLIVVDPRDIGLTQVADIHIKLKPGTNVAFANGIMNVMINEGLTDKKFIKSRTEGYKELAEIVKDYTPEKVAKICNINKDKLIEAARMYARADKAPIIYCLGVTEHSTGTEGVMSMSNMAMMVGKLGKPGCGVNPLRGQNNVQGACDMGALPVSFPGYQSVKDEKIIKKFERAWKTKLNRNPGMHATDVFGAAINKDIRGLFIFGEDPIVTDADQGHIKKALKSLDFFVLDDLFMTETAKYADVILPGTSYAEKEGTFTNTERRVQRVRKAVELKGNMRLDTDIFIDLMKRMKYKQKKMTSAQIMDEIASVTPSFAGISHKRLDSGETLQWPCTSKRHPGTPILHVDKFSRGRGWFYPAKYVPSAELPDKDYPFILMTGRILYHYNTRAMTGKTKGLMQREGKSYIEMNKIDADKLGIKDGDKIKVSSRRGSIKTTARVSYKVSQGETWMPFHFPDGYANILTNAALDKYARIPEYKVCAVNISK
ncbi:MAG: formate dehydrogenase subunit alpha [Coriobacteriia bacterium]|nr:formate dehydrogenase subunit alpha [Coriobacteriia bacterium]